MLHKVKIELKERKRSGRCEKKKRIGFCVKRNVGC